MLVGGLIDLWAAYRLLSAAILSFIVRLYIRVRSISGFNELLKLSREGCHLDEWDKIQGEAGFSCEQRHCCVWNLD